MARMPLTTITRGAQPHLAATPLAHRQSPGLLGGQAVAEACRFLDNERRTGDTADRRRNFSARLPARLGTPLPGLCTSRPSPPSRAPAPVAILRTRPWR